MKIFDLITMCLRNLTRRKVRTLLTVTGVVVGTSAIIVMISIGVGMNKSQEEMLAQMGDLTMIDIYNYGGQTTLDDKAMAQILALPHVEVATPFYQDYNINITMYAGKNDRYKMYMYNVVGIYPEAFAALGYQLKDGPGLTEGDAPYTIVFGEKAAYQFQDTKKRPGYNRVDPYPDANGNIKDPFVDLKKDKLVIRTEKQKDTAKEYEFKVAYGGTMVEDWSKGYQTSQGAFMDITDLKKIASDYYRANGIKKTEDSGYQEAKVKVTDMQYVAEVEEAIQDMGFQTSSMESIRKPMQEQVRQQQLVLGSLAAISLFVAALGITNTMVMSIYERTREIGVMKVLGCFVDDIRTVFLMEAGCIGFGGGVIGVIVSFIVSFLMNFFGFSIGSSMGGYAGAGSTVSIIPPWLVLFGLAFATCIGLVSGYYPANRAVQISALEAIKHD